MKVRCNVCGKVFLSEDEYLDGEHDNRIHRYRDYNSSAIRLIKIESAIPAKDVDAIR